MGQLINLADRRFGILTVLERVFPNSSKGESMWRCLCDCGNITVSRSSHLRRDTKSCGCANPVFVKHNMSHSPEYACWAAIIQRCCNPRSKAYKNYGGRGINVCEKWKKSFDDFLLDVGFRPSKESTLDRINNDDGYHPENVRWTSRFIQANNTRVNIYINYEGENHTIAEWSRILGMHVDTLRGRIMAGWSTEKAFFNPVRKRNG